MLDKLSGAVLLWPTQEEHKDAEEPTVICFQFHINLLPRAGSGAVRIQPTPFPDRRS